MDLAELKAQNEAEAQEQGSEGENQDNIDESVAQDPDAGNADDPDSDTVADSQEGGEDQKEIEPWQQVEDDKQIPLAILKDTRNKLKGRITERDEEIERLRAEMEELKQKAAAPIESAQTKLKRPRIDEFDTDEEYEKAIDDYQNKLIDQKYNDIEKNRQAENQRRKYAENITNSVNQHYERASKLVSESGIDPEVYKNADMNVRRAINNLRPGQGDIIADQLIDIVGDGSEKIMYYLGINKPALNQFLVLMSEDQTGYKAAAFLGEQKARLLSPQKQKSKARPPAPKIKGDASTGNNARRLMQQYKDAHKKGDSQAAYEARKLARQAKIDVSDW